jgi:hypothetical protein
LSGKKLAYQYWEVSICRVQPRSQFTIKSVLKSFQSNQTLVKYLPDEPLAHVTRDYLFTLVNTLDPTFFRRAEEDLESRLREKEIEKAVDVVEIDS